MLFCVGTNAALAHSKEDIMVMEQPYMVKETLWYEKMPFSPERPETAGLFFNFVDAGSLSGSTIVIAAVYRVGSPVTDYYGGQLPRPIRVIAVEESTGNVYQADLTEPDHPPVRVLVADRVVEEGGADGSFETAYFNFDLATLLKLPGSAGRYQVFLWLDELVSPVRTIDVPVNWSRGEGQPVTSGPFTAIKFASAAAAPEFKVGGPDLLWGSSIHPAAVSGFWVVDPGTRKKQSAFWVMLVSHRDRRFAWVALPTRQISYDQKIVQFHFNVRDLLKMSGHAQKIFALGLSGQGLSGVHVIQTR